MTGTLHDMTKSAADCRIAGICGGLGLSTPLPSWLWRAIFVLWAICGGIGLVAYIVLWIFMPRAGEAS